MLQKIFANKLLKNLLLAGLTAIIIIFLVLWWLKIYTNHAEKIETPNFYGLTITEGQKLASDNNLQLVVDSVFNSEIKKGTIFIQNPTPHTDSTNSWVKPNRKIYVTAVRNSVQMLSVPDIDGSELVILPRLSGRFTVERKYIPGAEQKVLYCEYNGKKVAQGDKLPRNSKITVFIGEKKKKLPVSVPNLRGLTINEANLKLADKGLGEAIALYNAAPCETAQDSLNAKIMTQQPAYSEDAKILQGTDMVVTCTCGALPDSTVNQ